MAVLGCSLVISFSLSVQKVTNRTQNGTVLARSFARICKNYPRVLKNAPFGNDSLKHFLGSGPNPLVRSCTL